MRYKKTILYKFYQAENTRKEKSIQELKEQKALQSLIDDEWSSELTDEETAEAARQHARFLPFYETAKGLITYERKVGQISWTNTDNEKFNILVEPKSFINSEDSQL